MDHQLVSCVVATQESRFELLKDAIRSYYDQSYPNRELVVVCSGSEEYIKRLRNVLSQTHTRLNAFIVCCPSSSTLGAVRNRSIECSKGDLICQWDDDDLYHPERIAVQVDALEQSKADACYLSEQYYFFVEQGRVHLRRESCIHGTVLYRRSVPCRYPEHGPKASKGEDTQFFRQLEKGFKITVVSGHPELYLRRFHGRNTWDSNHHQGQIARGATRAELVESRPQVEQHLRQFGLSRVVVMGRDGHAFACEENPPSEAGSKNSQAQS